MFTTAHGYWLVFLVLGYESFDKTFASPNDSNTGRFAFANETASSFNKTFSLSTTTEMPSPSVLDILMLNRKRLSQREKEIEEMKERMKNEEQANRSTSRTVKRVLLRDENKYEPYWYNGEWVFYRTIRPYIKLRTPKPMPTTTFSRVHNFTTTPYNQETTTINQNYTTHINYINYACQHPCSDVFENYGRVCAQRFNAFSYEYKQFDDICDMIDDNCVYHATTRASYNQDLSNFRGPWYVIMRGGCFMELTTFEPAPTNATKLLERVQFYNTLDFGLYRPKG